MTLSEIRKELGISRKAIQGYEKHGIISSDQKDSSGRHIYDEETVKRIIMIRFYQKLGFSLDEISYLVKENDNQIKQSMIRKKEEIEKEIVSSRRRLAIIESLLEKANEANIDFMLKTIKEENL